MVRLAIRRVFRRDFLWVSSNPSIATVDIGGMVTACKKGSVTITAKANDGSGKSVQYKLAIQQTGD